MASVYSQQGKRQRVKDGRSDNVDYFQGIDKVEYNNSAPATDSLSYKHYSGTERLHSRPMEDWMKCSVSFTEFRSHGYDHLKTRLWDDNTHSLDNHKRCIKALYDFCAKLGVKYWTAFDTDLVPLSDSWEENRAAWDEVVEYIQELSLRYHVKALWIAPDLHSHPRYTSGAITSNDATTFVRAAVQIKKCLEVSQKLNAECFLLWPYREGYDSIFQTDLSREVKLFAKLLKITAEYKDRLNYRCQLLIMPYHSCKDLNANGFYNGNFTCPLANETVNTYMWDVTSCLYLLKSYNLDRFYKVCAPPGHHMHMANVYNMLGGITITNDFNLYDSKRLTLMMKCIVHQGTAPAGGINLKLSLRRDCDPREMVVFYARCIDSIARGLRVACSIITEQLFSKHLQQRYATFGSGFGSRVVNNDVTLEECEEFHKKSQPHSEVASRTEHFETVFQRYIDACDHV